MALLKSVRFIVRQKQICQLFARLQIIGEKMLKDEENKNFTEEIERNGRKVLKTVSIFLFSAPFLSFTVSTILDYMTNFENKRLMAQVWIPWSMKQTWAYLLAKIWVSLMALCCIATYRGILFFDFVFTFEMSAYLKILQNYLETEGVKDKKIYEHHKVLIQLINDYNEIMSGVKYLDTILSPLLPCGFGMTFLKSLRSNERSQVDTLQKMLCCTAPPLITCWCGQEIITQVERLHEASYMNEWYEESPRYRRDLLLLMIRTTNVTTVNYRLFETFDRDLLSKVLQRMYSYFMVMVGIMDRLNN